MKDTHDLKFNLIIAMHIYYNYHLNKMDFEYSFFANEYLVTANILLLITFLLKNQIMFRMVLISAIVFLVFYNLSFPTLFLDVFITNLAMLFINIYNVLKLFRTIIPPVLDKESLYIYQKSFSKFLTKNQFKKLIEVSKRRTFRVNSHIALAKNGFTSLYLIVIIPENGEVKLRFKETFIASLEELSWIGVVEYVELLTTSKVEEVIKKGNTGYWGVDTIVQFDTRKNRSISKNRDSFLDESKSVDIVDLNNSKVSRDDTDESEDISELDDDEIRNQKEVIVYEWTLQDLCQIYSDSEDGNALKTSLHSIWLEHLAKFLKTKQATLSSVSYGRRMSKVV